MEKSTFLTQFLLLGHPLTLVFILALLILFVGIRQMEKRKIKFSVRMIVSTCVGLILGIIIQWVAAFPAVPKDVIWLNEVSSWYGLAGNGFMDLLKMLVVPLVFLSLVRVIMHMKGEGLGAFTAKTI